jgi:hypothetical protein
MKSKFTHKDGIISNMHFTDSNGKRVKMKKDEEQGLIQILLKIPDFQKAMNHKINVGLRKEKLKKIASK